MIRRPSHTPAQLATRATRRAFTLLEVLVVVAIIVMLAGIGSYFVFQRWEEARVSSAKVAAKKIADNVQLFEVKNGQPPHSLEDLIAPQGDNGDPLMTKDECVDPWGKPFQFEITTDGNGTKRVVVRTTGPKGQLIEVIK